MSEIYHSGWSPRNTPGIWDRNSISNDDAELLLDKYHVRRPDNRIVGAVAWFDTRNNLRMVACDDSCNRRIILRLNGGDWKLEILPEGAVSA